MKHQHFQTLLRLIASGKKRSLLLKTATLVLVLWTVLSYSRVFELIKNQIVVARFKVLKISRNVIAGEPDNPSDSWPLSYHFVHVNSRIRLTDPNPAFLVIFPFSDKNEKNISMEINESDKQSLENLKNFLSSINEFDGATCLHQTSLPERENEDRTVMDWRNISLLSSWCSFLKINWSVHIRNTGPSHRVYLKKAITGNMTYSPDNSNGADVVELQACNIVQGPFVMRKNVFREVGGLLDGFGRVTLLEFFLRSKRTLKIAKLANCIWTSQVTRTDRGTLEGSNNFSEYATLGNKHKILRIVQPRRIEWTTCVANWKLCKEEPYVKPRGLPGIALPICCSAVLGEMLVDFKRILNKLGYQYRITFGTLIGAVRNKAIIPYTHDVDIAFYRETFRNKTTYASLEQELDGKYYVGKSFNSVYRAHMLSPPYIEVDTDPFYNGPDDLKGERFFSPEIEGAVKGLLPISTKWRSRPYVDFYSDTKFYNMMNGSSMVTINGQNYVTVRNPDELLQKVYGDKYMKPSIKGKWHGMNDKKAPEN